MKQIGLLMVSMFVFGLPLVGVAGNVNISVGIAPPPLELAGPPDTVVVPSGDAYVYLVPNTEGLYFYNGFWYRTDGGRWWRSTIYNGGWGYIGAAYVPPAIVAIPPDYVLSMPATYHRIHYSDLHGHWSDWGRNHHWNNHQWYRDHDRHWGGHYRDRHPGYHGGGGHHPSGNHGGGYHGGGGHNPGGNHGGGHPGGGGHNAGGNHGGGHQTVHKVSGHQGGNHQGDGHR